MILNPHPLLRLWPGWLAAILLLASCDLRPVPIEPSDMPAERTADELLKITPHEAALSNDLEALRAYADRGQDWNVLNESGLTPLLLAVMSGHQVAVNFLIEAGADVNLADPFGSTPLHIAASQNQLHIARLLLLADARINAKDDNGFTPVEIASFMDHAEMMEFLVGAGAHPLADHTPDVDEDAAPMIVDSAPAPVRIEGDFRTWTSAKEEKIEAEFVEISMDLVVLRTRDDQLLRVPIQHLQGEDQIQARQLAAASRPPAARPPDRTDRTARTSASSIGLRIGRDEGWTVLEDCRLIRHSSNDGDSFHVRHDGKEYIFRLYYVDAAETDMRFPERIREQAKYFKLTDKDMLRLGEDATRFMNRTLSGKSFTAVTRWEDARGSSRLPRHFAFIVTDEGDLDELLTAAGLVRIYGMPVLGSLGRSKRSQLERLEQSAKHERSGAWGMK